MLLKHRKVIFLNPKFVNLALLPQSQLFICLYKLLPIEKNRIYIFAVTSLFKHFYTDWCLKTCHFRLIFLYVF